MTEDPASSSIGRRQIAALAYLVDLSNSSDRTGRELEARESERSAWIARRYARTADRVETRAGNVRRRLHAEQKRQREALATQLIAARAKLESEESAKRAALETEAQEALTKVRGEYDHERWVADSVLEGRRAEIKQEHQSAAAALGERRRHLRSTDEQAEVRMRRYRRPAPEGWRDPVEADAPAPGADPVARWTQLTDEQPARRDALDAAARRLHRQGLPRLMAGMTNIEPTYIE